MWRQRRLIRDLLLSNQPKPKTGDTSGFFTSHYYYYFTEIPKKKKGKITPTQERRIVDRFRLWVKGGHGGKGCTSCRKSIHARYGAPDGGDGGRGGDVILECSSVVWDLSNLQHHLNAQKGGHGLPKNKVGTKGADKVVQVPVGTLVHLVDGTLPSQVESCPQKKIYPWEILPAEASDDDDAVNKFQDGSEYSSKQTLSENGDVFPSENRRNENHSESKSSGTFDEIGKFKKSMVAKHVEDFSGSDKDDEEYYDSQTDDIEMSESNGDDNLERTMYLNQEIQYSVAEFIEPGQRILVASGGSGGRGNVSMTRIRNSKKLKPRVKPHSSAMDSNPNCDHEPGQPGSEAYLILELKLIADIGLVGMPNAGKSTLLGAISRAKPTVGHYAFTTLRPSIGMLEYDDFYHLTVADIPGLIKGAHQNRGLGHAFLRHIERTKALAYVVDLSSALGGKSGPQPWEQLKDLVFELEQHQTGLSDRASLIVANKIDELGAEEAFNELKRRVPSAPIFPVCAVLEEGIPELKNGLRKLIDGTKPWRPEPTDCFSVH